MPGWCRCSCVEGPSLAAAFRIRRVKILYSGSVPELPPPNSPCYADFLCASELVPEHIRQNCYYPKPYATCP